MSCGIRSDFSAAALGQIGPRGLVSPGGPRAPCGFGEPRGPLSSAGSISLGSPC